jgi:iron complex outermembrane recepter protein
MFRKQLFLFVIALLFIATTAFAEEEVKTTIEEKKVFKLDKIVVTATRTEKDVSEAPASTSVVTKNEVEERNIQAIDQAANALPGVFERRGKGVMDTQAAITMRGMPGQQRTLIMLDGISLNRAYDGTVTFGGIAPENLERVEAVRGPSSSLYGGYAMGGVVNFITKMPEKQEITLKGGYGPDGLWTTYGSYGDKFANKVSTFFSYGYRSTRGDVTDYVVTTTKPAAGYSGWSPTTDRYGKAAYLVGDKGRNGWRDENITAKIAYDVTPASRITLSFMRNLYEYNYGTPNAYVYRNGLPAFSGFSGLSESSFIGYPGGKSQDIYKIGYETKLSDAKVKFLAAYNRGYSWYNASFNAATTKLSGGPGTEGISPSGSWDVDLQVTKPLFQKHLITVGGTYRYNWAFSKMYNLTYWKDENSFNGFTRDAGGKDMTYALFAQVEIHPMDKLTAYIGFREDWWRGFDGYSNSVGINSQYYSHNSVSSFNPKGALVYTPFKNTVLRASIGKAFRAPTLYELYGSYTTTGGITYAGNPNLKPETVMSWDVGAEQLLWKNGVFKTSYFQSYIDDLIYSRTLSATLTDKINVGRATIRGVELGFEQKLDMGLKLFTNYTWNDARVDRCSIKPQIEGKRLTYVPSQMFNIGGTFVYKSLTTSFTGRYVGKRYQDDNNSDRANGVYLSYDPFFTADAKVSYQVASMATISLSVDNIFDKDYFSSYQAPGRKWYGGLTLKF